MAENQGTSVADEANQNPVQDTSSSGFEVSKFSRSFSCSKEILKWRAVETGQKFAPRVGHAMVSRTVDNVIKLYMLGGGNHDGDIRELWELVLENGLEDCDGDSDTDWKLIPTSDDYNCRYEFAAALSPDKSQWWMFGGADCEKPRNDVCYLDLDTLVFVEKAPNTSLDSSSGDQNVPSARTQGGNSCLLQIEGKSYMAVCGGGAKGEKAVPDGNLYLFDTANGTWERVDVIGDTPGKRQGHGMISFGSKIFLHGGMHEFQIYDDLYMIDLSEIRTKQPSWIKIRGGEKYPCARAAHGFIRMEQEIFLFGGLGNDGALGDLWKFRIDSMEWTEVLAPYMPSPRLDAALTVVSTNQDWKILLVHGGMNTEGSLFNDFWTLRLR